MFFIHRFQRSSSLERPSRGGEQRTALGASPHEERGSDGAVAPPMGAHRVGCHRCVVRECYNPSGSAVVTCLHAAARPRRAARAVQGEVVSVWQALQGTPRAPRMTGLGITPLLIKPWCPDNARVAGFSGRVAPGPFPALVGRHDTRDIMWLGTHTGRRAFHKQT